MTMALDKIALDTLFREARARCVFLDEAIPEATLRAIYDLMKRGPTSANSCPARIVFVTSEEGRAALRPAVDPEALGATLQAPVTAIVAYDKNWHEVLPRLYPQAEDARSWFAWNDEFSLETAVRNGSLQGGYLILAARLLGLDCWPMSGFDAAKVDSLFLDGRGWRANFLLSLGYAEPVEGPRNPRLTFAESCEVI